MTEFQSLVFAATKKIPKGQTRTYAQIAQIIGRPKSARAVGNALNKNRNQTVPCHRVIKSNGELGGFAFGAAKKRALLTKEGFIQKN